MAFTYDPAKLSVSPLFQVRLLLQDTDKNFVMLQDEEISFLITQKGSVNAAAAAAADNLAAKFARLADETVGKIKINWSNAYEQMRALAERLRRDSLYGLAMPYAGGISKADKQANESNSDRVEPIFTRDLHDSDGSLTNEEGDE